MSVSPLIAAESDSQPSATSDRLRGVAQRLFVPLDELEVQVVRRVVSFAVRFRLEPLAVAATRAGNGWLYPLVTLILAVTERLDYPVRFAVCSGASVVTAFAIYPALKRLLARCRPCDYDPTLVRDLCPIDRYSCPSGHAMTAAAYGVTLVFAHPAAAPLAVILCATIGWSRVALGHHYVSDVVAGTVIGAAIAVPFSILLL